MKDSPVGIVLLGGGAIAMVQQRTEDRCPHKTHTTPQQDRQHLLLICIQSARAVPTLRLLSAHNITTNTCLLYTSDAADEEDSVDLGGRRIIKKKKERKEGGSVKK
eukprot:TRINITY_DN2202_c0_g1_i1.p1 TRINITY_DN2202_c0_g1~~TRINITY_DN2202_c0_g1_i1.p1  ORF type:complete len:106 (+),score=24.11 TRINITY_DN2202_c0_g1_i1:348-665(+)